MPAIAQFVMVLSLASGLLGCTDRPRSASHDRHELVGRKAPLFTATTLDERPFDLGEHLGQGVIILDFWATWCGPCVAALPVLAEVAGEYQGKGVQFFAVNLSEDPEAVRAFLDEHKIDLRIVMDRDGAIGDLYKVEAIPQTVIIDKEGTVQVVHVGVPPNLKNELSRDLDELLAGKKLAAQGQTRPGVPSELEPAEAEVPGRAIGAREIVLK